MKKYSLVVESMQRANCQYLGSALAIDLESTNIQDLANDPRSNLCKALRALNAQGHTITLVIGKRGRTCHQATDLLLFDATHKSGFFKSLNFRTYEITLKN